jgi:RNA polymerase sigma factor (sigma-70 family)
MKADQAPSREAPECGRAKKRTASPDAESDDAGHEDFYRAYFRAYIVFAVRSFGLRQEIASEIVQEVFGRLLSARYSVQNRRAWVTKTVVRECIAHKRKEIGVEVPLEVVEGRTGGDPATKLIQRLLVEAGLGELGVRDREILRLHYFEGFTVKEIAGIQGISEAYAERRRGIALDRLRVCLGLKVVERS